MAITTDIDPRAGDARPAAVPGWTWWAIGAVVALFAFLPDIDLAASRVLADAQGTFPLRNHAGLMALSDAIAHGARVFSSVLFVALVLAWLPRFGRPARWRAWLIRRRVAVLFLALVMSLGPGLLVSTFLKENWGRARPVSVSEFGGDRRFTPPLVPADQCEHNCAFVSGHAAVAAFPVTGYFLARTRRARRGWLATGIGLAAAVGLLRLALGSHFLSDVVFAFLSTYLIAAACAPWVLRRYWDSGQDGGGEPASRR